MAKEPSKREGGIFGGKGSLKEDLRDISGDDKITFADTWLGDLLGFDGKAGVQGAGLKESWYGARRKPYRERVKEVPSLERAVERWTKARQEKEKQQEELRNSFDDKAAATDRAVRNMSRENFPFFDEVPPVKRISDEDVKAAATREAVSKLKESIVTRPSTPATPATPDVTPSEPISLKPTIDLPEGISQTIDKNIFLKIKGKDLEGLENITGMTEQEFFKASRDSGTIPLPENFYYVNTRLATYFIDTNTNKVYDGRLNLLTYPNSKSNDLRQKNSRSNIALRFFNEQMGNN